ncbi:NrfD/PsrC family molybdoenzyme membrane anchor subunit [Mycobacterium palustre]|uniref:Nitrite reductase n=1 Tax=Mycobacterium palustre TaxID=153971 RepID=A0A1X1ZXZ6_9MYCO|nr:NrfD/PsrC family molybdoenzyme membrane anchor subunit [Mycobacterium palustre]MCV7100705.1 polysulfide reductase NrfD [Mycobacterium palustre]ORW29750.1 nitrite reductase [Mycobacterium palustre]
MSTSEYDSLRPPEPAKRRKGRRAGRRGGGDGAREMPMVPDVEFSSYYGRPVVKPAPWGHEVAAYLFLGGVAGGSGLLAAGAQLTGRDTLRRNARLSALVAVLLGAVALVKDLGRPERFVNMLRTVKLTSPMSIGSWILSLFSAGIGVAAVSEVDRMTGERIPLGPLRNVLRAVEGPAGLEAAVFSPPLAVYTAVLLTDTATPTWNAAYRDLPFVFVSSASLAASGLAMITTPVAQAGPARRLAVIGAIGDLVSARFTEHRMDPVTREPLHHGRPGRLLAWSERLAAAGGLGALLGGRHRGVAALSGLALLSASAMLRFGFFEAGLESARDPRYTIEPQKRRLEARRAAGITGDSITTAG